MSAITWRTIAGNNPVDPSRALLGAQQSFNGMFDVLNKAMTTKYEAGQEEAKQAFLNSLYGTKSVEDFDGQQEALQSGLQGLSAANQAAVRPLLEQRRAQLMDQTLKQQEFSDAQIERANAPVLLGLQEARLRATSPEEIANIDQAIGIYQSNNMLSPKAATELIKENMARGREIEDDQWKALERDQQITAWNDANATAPLQRKLLEAQVNKTIAEAEKERNGDSGVGIAGLGPLIKGFEAVRDNANAPNDAALERNPFNGDLAVEQKGQDATRKVLEDTGVNAWNVLTDKNNFVTNLVKEASSDTHKLLSPDGKFIYLRNSKGEVEAKLPFTASLLESAIRQDNGDYIDPSLDGVLNRLKTMANNGSWVEDGVKFTEAKEAKNINNIGAASNIANIVDRAMGRFPPPGTQAQPAKPEDEVKKK